MNKTIDMFEADEPATEPYVYRCAEHSYVLKSSFPAGIGKGLKPFCPLCRDEFLARHIPVLVNENPRAGKPVEK